MTTCKGYALLLSFYTSNIWDVGKQFPLRNWEQFEKPSRCFQEMASMILVKSQAIKNNTGMDLFIFPTAHESWHLCSFIIICTIKIIPMDTFVTGLAEICFTTVCY